MSAFKDLTGQIFGRLTALRAVGRSKQGNTMWLCRCSADGNEIIARNSHLLNGDISSCGCVMRTQLVGRFGKDHPTFKHGHGGAADGKHKSRTYQSWEHVMQRCLNPNNDNYFRYGAAGVTVCARWRIFENFLADIGERPEGTSLGRFGDVGNYEPGNCAWQTPKEQAAEQKTKRQLQCVAA